MTLVPDQPSRFALPRLDLSLPEGLIPSPRARRQFGPTVIAGAFTASGVLLALSNGITDGRLYAVATLSGFALCMMLEGIQAWRERVAQVVPAE